MTIQYKIQEVLRIRLWGNTLLYTKNNVIDGVNKFNNELNDTV